MRRIFVIRHAKSSWEDMWVDDFDRTLNERGQRDAPAMAARLAAKGVVPDLIVSSTAVRAKTTAIAFAKGLGYNEQHILWKDELYEAEPDTIYKVVREIDNKYENVLVFGHNPGFTYFANDLANIHIDNLPTCGIVAIGLDGEWKSVKQGIGRFVWFDCPKGFI